MASRLWSVVLLLSAAAHADLARRTDDAFWFLETAEARYGVSAFWDALMWIPAPILEVLRDELLRMSRDSGGPSRNRTCDLQLIRAVVRSVISRPILTNRPVWRY